MHVTANPEDYPVMQAKIESLRAIRVDVFNVRPSMIYSELLTTVKTAVKCWKND